MSASSPENRIPTQQFLLPGQSFCIGLPWERASLPRHGLEAGPLPAPLATALDGTLEGDPCTGWEIGRCEVVRRLSPGSARRLLALRREGSAQDVVELRLLDVGEGDGPLIEAWAHEASRVQHPMLARVFECEVADEGIFWVSERVSGATLAELATVCRAKGRSLPLGLVLAAVHDAALALGALHSRGAHGLVSDHAVAVGFDGSVRLVDAGLFPCLARKRTWAEVLEVVGPYLAPEQVLQGRAPDARTDVFALAAVLYEALAQERFPRAASFDERVKAVQQRRFAQPSTLNVMLGKALDEVMFRALSTDRAWRFDSGADFAKQLKKAASSFMWRPEARSEFIGELLETRKRNERALTAHLTERRTRTVSVQLPVVEPLPEPGRPRVEMPVVRPLPPPPVRAAPSSLPGALLRVGLGAVMGLVVGLLLSMALSPPPPPPVAAAPELAVVPAPPPPVAPIPDAEMSRESLVLASIGELRVVEAEPTQGKAAKPKVRRPKKVDDAPVPSWLKPRRR